jgi:hypothetical protein
MSTTRGAQGRAICESGSITKASASTATAALLVASEEEGRTGGSGGVRLLDVRRK